MKPPTVQPIEIMEANFLPIIRSFIQRIELEETIDRLVCSEMRVPVSKIFSGMVMDALSGRTPLFRPQKDMDTARINDQI